uniref:MutS_I domain-containing protein n=1 Tax=Hydatigena taeniaeformis TaxID=6205 RepID=A0A0R3WUW0_HYDTA
LRVALTPHSLPIGASHRLWISAEGSPIPRTALNGDNHEADGTPTKTTEEVPGTKRARRHLSPVPRSDSRGSGLGRGGGGEQETGNATDTMEKNQDPRLLDTFCVASFTLPAWRDKDTAAGDGAQLDEHENLVRDIAAINPDVFCVKQAHADYATLHLRPELSRQGYQCSGGTDDTAASFQSFIFFSREVFSEVAFHCRPVQSMARKV